MSRLFQVCCLILSALLLQPVGVWLNTELAPTAHAFVQDSCVRMNDGDIEVGCRDGIRILSSSAASAFVNLAADFEESSAQALTTANTDSLDPDGGDFSGHFWMKLESLPSVSGHNYYAQSTRAAPTANDNGFGVGVGSATNTLFFYAGTGAASTLITRVGALSIDTWYFVAFKMCSTGNAVQLDGEAPTTGTARLPVSSGEPFEVGRSSTAVEFDGLIARMTTYDAICLTDAEFDLARNGGAATALQCSETAATVGQTPTDCWNMNEVNGTRSPAIGSSDLAEINGPISSATGPS